MIQLERVFSSVLVKRNSLTLRRVVLLFAPARLKREPADLTRARRVDSGTAFWVAASWTVVYLPVLRPVMARASLSAGFMW
jgi:hypothetical protein